MFKDFIYLIIDLIEEKIIDLRDYFLDLYETYVRKNDEEKILIDAKVEEIFFLIREYIALDSQFTRWITRGMDDFLEMQERRFVRKLYKKKLKIKNLIERRQKELERKDINDTDMGR